MKISGSYRLNIQTPIGLQNGSLTLTASGATLSGTLVNARGSTGFTGGSVNGNEVEFSTKIQTPLGRMKAHVTGKIEGDHFSGIAKLPLGTAHLEGQRIT